MEELADDAAHEADRQEHGDDRERGREHRQADLVRAVERRLVRRSVPICTWRTMFSRTTIASSISRPTHSDSAIIVMMLMVKPNMYMNEERADQRDRQREPGDHGRAPGVEEQEHDQDGQHRAFEQRAWTLATATRIARELSWMTSSLTPGGSRALSASIVARQAVDDLDGVLALRLHAPRAAPCAGRCRAPGCPAPAAPSTTVPPDERTGMPRVAARGARRRCAEVLRALAGGASICTTVPARPSGSAPGGSSWFSLRTARDHLVDADAKRFHAGRA